MKAFATKLKTFWSLGLLNIARVATYRAGIKSGLSRVRRLRAEVSSSPFFRFPSTRECSVPAVSAWISSARLFGNIPYGVAEAAPDWLGSPVSESRKTSAHMQWWNIPDFDPKVGDIKLIWELSRMDWALAFAQRAALGDEASMHRLNSWLDDWCQCNPPYREVNWKCGQEASIRVIHLSMAALILGQVEDPTAALITLIRTHLQRIAPTMQYAIAQDNNHGTSEAAALFIGGSWLSAQGFSEGGHWCRIGRKWIENRADRLIGPQGSFSQYSMNYHRLMLDTFSVVEVWRRHLALPVFSARLLERVRVATYWLYCMVSPVNGKAPNIGANDGARLLQLADTEYVDYRPTVQLAMALFSGTLAYSNNGNWNHPLRWLDVPVPVEPAQKPMTWIADDGGFAVLRRAETMAVFRYPRFRFRPSQSDALHVDLWVNGINLLRDAGTYSYNTDQEWLSYFSGTAGHNTVQFDDRDQMPRLGRFLFGSWLKSEPIEVASDDPNQIRVSAGYRDAFHARHRRQVNLFDSHLQVIDEIEEFSRKAVLRWRLAPGTWELEGQCLTNGIFRLSVQADVPITRLEIVTGWESLHYLEKTPIPVLEVEVLASGTLTTTFQWNP
jgi:hypothetical protein